VANFRKYWMKISKLEYTSFSSRYSEITGKELMTKLRWEEIGGRLVLFIFSFLLERHAIWSRYPDDEFNPLEYYNERTPLIKRFNEIANMIDGALKEIEQLYGIS
jgi:hypothetical protein